MVHEGGWQLIKTESGQIITIAPTVMEVHTDKVNAEIPSPIAGVVEDLLLEVGDPVIPGQPIARIAPE